MYNIKRAENSLHCKNNLKQIFQFKILSIAQTHHAKGKLKYTAFFSESQIQIEFFFFFR